MRIFKTATAIAIISVACNGALADSTTTQLAETMMDSVNMEQVLDQVIGQTLEAQLNQNPAMQPYKEVIRQFFARHIGYQVVRPELAALYGDAYTADELREIIAFYQTPTGKRTILLMPELMQKGMQLSQRHVQENLPELQSDIAREASRIQKLQAR